jgi:hypothetical protein
MRLICREGPGNLKWLGCGSVEVSWLRCEDLAVAVFRVVNAFVLAAQVEAPLCAAPDYVRTGAVGSVWPGLAGARGVIVT